MSKETQPGSTTISADKNCRMSYEQLFNFAFNDRFIPLLKRLADQYGPDRFLESVREISCDVLVDRIKRNKPENNSLAAFISEFKREDSFIRNIMEFDIVEDSDKAFELRITRCLYADAFCQAGAGDIGHGIFCHADEAAARAFNPRIKFSQSENLMKGDACCTARWERED